MEKNKGTMDEWPPKCRPPETVLQFGTGVFLLGFADWIIDQLNQRAGFNAGVVAFKARPGNSAQLDPINRYDGEFELWLRGFRDGRLVDEVQPVRCLRRALNPFDDYAAARAVARNPALRWVVSNTTEAGIRYQAQPAAEQEIPQTFPALLTDLLYQRFQHFAGDSDRGLAILCCELIEDNGSALRDIVLRHARDWQLPGAFSEWLDTACAFCNTLVDRIVTGEPAAAPPARGLPDDALLIEAEAFHAWVIEAPEWVRKLMPVEQAGVDVSFVEDLGPYRARKVRILNGAHTATFALSLMLGVETVYDTLQHPLLRRYLENLIYNEVCPTLDDPEIRGYAAAILQRFENPHVEHRWENIALNAASKWRARLLPTLQDAAAENGAPTPLLTLSLAALMAFYRGGFCGEWRGAKLPVRDNPSVVAAFEAIWREAPDNATAVARILASEGIWDGPLPEVPGLAPAVCDWLADIDRQGLEPTLEALLND